MSAPSRDAEARTGAQTVSVTIAWAAPAVQELVALTLPAGARAGDAVARSGLVERHRIDRSSVRLGIGGRLVGADTLLADGDRVELLRPLAIDPKDARRLRAQARARRHGTAEDDPARRR
jgi:putative ubiquitin-RnfH superfamily antitoxin RatB of RatAB toxin-antitoxin module